MARNGIIAFGLLFSIQSASAAPFDLGSRIVVQPDGISFIANELVDEFGHYVSAEKGYVVQNQSTGYYYYAHYDTAGHKTPTSLRVGRDDESSDVIRLTHLNYVRLKEMSRFFQGRVRVRSEIGEPLPAIYLAALCANGIAVPESQDNRGLVKDCEVLLAVRDSLAGLRGTPLNWSADIPISDWVGVTVSNGRVTELALSARHLMGTISPRLAQLSELTGLFLHGNTLTGTIPPELGQLTQLRMLALEFNELTGAIPPELGQLSELKWLFLGYNGLTGAIPPEVGQLGHLEHLALNDNALTGAIPPELGQLSHLEHLALNGNALTRTIPPELGQLPHLKNLSLNDNALTGTIPPELGQLTQLVRLNLDTNQLIGPIPPEVGQIDHLESLWLGDNALTGTIPPELGQLTQLRALSLHNNELTGTIPPELAKLRELKVLIFGHNALTGPIPPELGQLNQLEGLYLSNNALTGPIPPELATLTELNYLHLAFNELTGSIPPELGQLTGLLQFNLRNNELTEPNLCTNGIAVPEPQSNSGLVEDCKVLLGVRDRLAGDVFLNWSAYTPIAHWEGISISDARVTALILNYENLAVNDGERLEWLRLTGSIPPELGQLTELEYLSLKGNALTGPIPPELGQLTKLKLLNLDSNRLTCVPEALAEWADDLPLCPDVPSASDATATSMEVVSQNVPTTSGLSPNFPNPFNTSTQIAYDIAASGPVRLKIYNTLGQPVRTLVDQFQAVGSHQVRWDARDQRGAALAAGVYLARLRYPGGEQIRRLLLLK